MVYIFPIMDNTGLCPPSVSCHVCTGSTPQFLTILHRVTGCLLRLRSQTSSGLPGFRVKPPSGPACEAPGRMNFGRVFSLQCRSFRCFHFRVIRMVWWSPVITSSAQCSMRSKPVRYETESGMAPDEAGQLGPPYPKPRV